MTGQNRTGSGQHPDNSCPKLVRSLSGFVRKVWSGDVPDKPRTKVVRTDGASETRRNTGFLLLCCSAPDKTGQAPDKIRTSQRQPDNRGFYIPVGDINPLSSGICPGEEGKVRDDSIHGLAVSKGVRQAEPFQRRLGNGLDQGGMATQLAKLQTL